MLYQRMASIKACLWASQQGSALSYLLRTIWPFSSVLRSSPPHNTCRYAHVACSSGSVGKAGVQIPDSYLFTDSAILYPQSQHCCAE